MGFLHLLLLPLFPLLLLLLLLLSVSALMSNDHSICCQLDSDCIGDVQWYRGFVRVRNVVRLEQGVYVCWSRGQLDVRHECFEYSLFFLMPIHTLPLCVAGLRILQDWGRERHLCPHRAANRCRPESLVVD
jgi:hypothetical protein